MDNRLNRLEEKLDRVLEVQSEMKADVQEHIRRTEIAESNIEKISENIRPIQEHVAFIRISGRLLAIISTLAAIYAAFR